MKITNVSVRVRSAAAAGDFYACVLGLTVEREVGLVAATVGATRLELVEDPETVADHHFAITIPRNKFSAAKEWIQERTVLLKSSGADEFECSPDWNARSLYFAGPDGSVLELILRRDLANTTPGPFTSADLLGVSEVGVAVTDVSALATTLEHVAGIAPYGHSRGEDFAPVGNADGLLILVTPGRAWFPTADRVADESPIAITAVGGCPGNYELGRLGSLMMLP